MRKSIAGGVLALALSFAAGAFAAPTDEEVRQTGRAPAMADQINKLESQLRTGDLKGAHETLAAITHAPTFASLPVDARARILTLDAQIAGQLGLTDYAAAASSAAAKLPGQQGAAVETQLIAAITTRDGTAARRAVTTLANQYPKVLAAMEDNLVLASLGGPMPDAAAEAAQGDAAEALMAHWTPQSPTTSLDGVRLWVVNKRLGQGQIDEARRIAGAITLRDTGLAMRTTRRYDALFADGWTLRTPREGGEARLAELRAARVKNPRSLTGALQEASILMELRANAEALQVIDTALAQAERSPNSFDDTADRLSWLREARGRALEGLGRHAEAMAIARRAAETTEGGRLNVSNLLNFSLRLTDDDPKEAVRLADEALTREPSAYGRSVALHSKACALQALGQPAAAEAAYGQLRAIKEPGANLNAVDTALCLGKEDEAATALVRALNDPAERQRAIMKLQVDIPETNPSTTDRQRTIDALFRKVVFRSDVQAALAPHGKMISFKPEDLWRSL